jgi:hypothetical protein
MQYLFRLTRGLVRNAAIASTVLVAASITLRADSTCIGDCGSGSHLSGISGTEDIEAGGSGFDIFFKPGLPGFFSSDSSNKQNSGSSDDYFVSGGWGGGGALQFDSGGGSPGSNNNPPGPDDNSIQSLLNQIFNSPGGGWKSAPPPMDPDPPAPTPEPRYSALAMLGLGWALFGSYRIVRSRLSNRSAL